MTNQPKAKRTKRTPEELADAHADVQQRLRNEFYERQARQTNKRKQSVPGGHRKHKDM